MSNRISMPSVPAQAVKKTASVPSNALIRQLLTNGSRGDPALAQAIEQSDPESDVDPSDDDDDDKSLGGRGKGISAAGRVNLPRSALRSLVRTVLGNVRTSPDAITCLNSAGARFVLTVSRRASRICEDSGRSLITGDDLLRAMSSVGCSSLVNTIRQQYAPNPAAAEEAEAAVASSGATKTKGRRPSEPVLGNIATTRKRRRGTTGGENVDTEELQARQLALLMEARQADDLAAQQLEAVPGDLKLETVQVEVATDDGHTEADNVRSNSDIPSSLHHLITSQNAATTVELHSVTGSGGGGGGGTVVVEKTSHLAAINDAEDYDT